MTIIICYTRHFDLVHESGMKPNLICDGTRHVPLAVRMDGCSIVPSRDARVKSRDNTSNTTATEEMNTHNRHASGLGPSCTRM